MLSDNQSAGWNDGSISRGLKESGAGCIEITN